MSILVSEIREGAYADSIVLMQLQSDLLRLPGVLDAGVVMGSAVNLELLRSSSLLTGEAAAASTNDLIIVLQAESVEAGQKALAEVDILLRSDRSEGQGDFRPRSLSTALQMIGYDDRWVSISIPGRYAPEVAREALEESCHVFLYSDNVDLEREAELKMLAAERGRLLMGPDCGSAMIGGVGFGFTNHVRHGPVGLICASGTGLQSVSTQIHQLGSGISHAIGTGGRDLTATVGGVTATQGLDLLARDNATRVVVVVSKPPDPMVRIRLLAIASTIEKPVVVYFSGSPPPAESIGNLSFARSLRETAELAVALVEKRIEPNAGTRKDRQAGGRFLRGLFAGGTLAQETLQGAATFLSPVYSNLAFTSVVPLADPTRSREHTILDLGADEFTVGRLHPMMDPRLRLDRIRQESDDPETGSILIDVILGRGSHPDPAAELAPVLSAIHRSGGPRVVALVVGTDEDSQDLASTCDRLEAAGATVCTTVAEALESALASCAPDPPSTSLEVDSRSLNRPAAIINIGLESLFDESVDQGVETIQVEWRPTAGGNEKLMAILEKMKA